MQQQRGIAAVVQNHVGVAAVVPLKDFVGVVPVIGDRFTLDGKHRDAFGGNGGCGVVLRGEDVAGSPTDFSAQCRERFNQNGRLNGHVQATGNTSAL